jgi:IS5 family transposase
MKCHIGVDEENGIVHTVLASTAKEADITYLPALLHGEETTVRGDSAYSFCTRYRGARRAWSKTLLTPKKKPVGGELTQAQKDKNQRLCSKRAPVEHPFHIVKCLFGYRKVRYRGLFKNRMHQLTLFMLANLFKETGQNRS